MKIKTSRFNSVNSTNDEAIKLIKKNFFSPRIIISKNQIKGRGTRGKKWDSIYGNIFLSIYFNLKYKKNIVNEISILNAYILKNIFEKYSKHRIKIKWPNDLLVEGKKFCGILQETINVNTKKYLIIGIGINSKFSPDAKKFNSTYLNKYSKNLTHNNKLINDIKNTYEQFISDIYEFNISYLKKKYKEKL